MEMLGGLLQNGCCEGEHAFEGFFAEGEIRGLVTEMQEELSEEGFELY